MTAFRTYDIYQGGMEVFGSVWSEKTRSAAACYFQPKHCVENNNFSGMWNFLPEPQQPPFALLPPESFLHPQPMDLLSPQSRLHNWMRKEDIAPPTLAELFQSKWDPEFTEYLKALITDSCSTVQVDINLPNQSVDNYTIELIVAEGARNGPEAASAKIESLLEQVALHLRNEYRNMLIQRARALIRKRQLLPLCAFCRNNGEKNFIYLSHVLKDEIGRVMCPILRAYTCPRCGQNGDGAHTLKYCPIVKKELEMQRELREGRIPAYTIYAKYEQALINMLTSVGAL